VIFEIIFKKYRMPKIQNSIEGLENKFQKINLEIKNKEAKSRK
jgi:hypothetical protein